jgi:hypothetical protein
MSIDCPNSSLCKVCHWIGDCIGYSAGLKPPNYPMPAIIYNALIDDEGAIIVQHVKPTLNNEFGIGKLTKYPI